MTIWKKILEVAIIWFRGYVLDCRENGVRSTEYRVWCYVWPWRKEAYSQTPRTGIGDLGTQNFQFQ